MESRMTNLHCLQDVNPNMCKQCLGALLYSAICSANIFLQYHTNHSPTACQKINMMTPTYRIFFFLMWTFSCCTSYRFDIKQKIQKNKHSFEAGNYMIRLIQNNNKHFLNYNECIDLLSTLAHTEIIWARIYWKWIIIDSMILYLTISFF